MNNKEHEEYLEFCERNKLATFGPTAFKTLPLWAQYLLAHGIAINDDLYIKLRMKVLKKARGIKC